MMANSVTTEHFDNKLFTGVQNKQKINMVEKLKRWLSFMCVLGDTSVLVQSQPGSCNRTETGTEAKFGRQCVWFKFWIQFMSKPLGNCVLDWLF